MLKDEYNKNANKKGFYHHPTLFVKYLRLKDIVLETTYGLKQYILTCCIRSKCYILSKSIKKLLKHGLEIF